MDNTRRIDGNMSTDLEAEKNLTRDFMKTADKLSTVASGVTATANQRVRTIKNYCRENPFQSMGIAAVMGVFAGMVLLRSLSSR